ncbi:aldo/keto reductase [Tannerella sp.]|uniref:aldo/keto reductase n=1 Tax=Tannerella sp. TaxID=2382127 RepID=UPI0026DC2E6D|nr:aldo/keto reductase [Tannerella sp.]MDO4703350.1 aldo/keto reductase [Tannerella sp.]
MRTNDLNRREFIALGTLVTGGLFAAPLTSCSLKAESPSPAKENLRESIRKRTLGTGKHALDVSAVGLGCMGMSYHRSFIPDPKKMETLLRQAVDRGQNFFDTAEAYGPQTNEALVGKALKTVRKDVVLATKFGFVNGRPSEGTDSSPKRIREVVEQSLKNLQTDYIDLLYQHRVDPNVPIEEVAGTVKELISEGKVLHFGMSEADAETLRKAHSTQPVTAIQSEYSLMTRIVETNGVLHTCEELGIGFVPYSPLSRALLTGYINERTKFNPDNDNRHALPRYQPTNIIENWKLIDLLKEFGDHRGLTVAQVALAWLLAQKPWIVPIPGTTKLAHLYENMLSAEFEFAPDELQLLTEKINQVQIVGERYTGISAQQASK